LEFYESSDEIGGHSPRCLIKERDLADLSLDIDHLNFVSGHNSVQESLPLKLIFVDLPGLVVSVQQVQDDIDLGLIASIDMDSLGM
jgi:hypothetical protein